MQWLWAVLAALLLAAAVVWWMDRDTDRCTGHNGSHHVRGNDRGPTLYRWVDAGGVINIADTPPKDRRYTVVRIDPKRNLVPSATDDATVIAPKPR